ALALIIGLTPASADKCVIPGSEADIYNPGQKAIIAWNGTYEELILSTDLYSSRRGVVFELMPLPSMPEVEKGSYDSFKAVQEIIMRRAVKGLPAPGKESEGLEIVFHEKIGAHDITVVKASDAGELLKFVSNRAESLGISIKAGEKVEEIFEDYLARGFGYWVLDVVEVGDKVRSVEPIVYRFRSDELYYPLKVSRAAEGETQITLYLIARSSIREDLLPQGFRIASYAGSKKPLSYSISGEELEAVDPKIARMFDGGAWFTAVIYRGSLEGLREDLEIGKSQDKGCRLIEVEVEKGVYGVGEPVRIRVNFIHLLPGCFEVMVLHHHEIRLEVISEDGALLREWRWKTSGDLSRTVSWTPEEEGSYRIIASSWFDGRVLEVQAEEVIEVRGEGRDEHGDAAASLILSSLAFGGAFTALGVAIGYLVASKLERR
ncbi:MAG TPA: DUF2330 domain-containing protein, partial [Nitrososphaeria archaeon]|nr:DUF2330 domain-containing protein [Nitrososphaeria archaeon]